MAEALLGAAVEVLLDKAIHLASEQIGLFFGFEKDLEKLKETLIWIKAVLHDAERKQVTEGAVKLWLEDLERVAFHAGNVLDDFNYEMIRRQVEIQNETNRQVRYLSSLNPFPFRFKRPSQIEKIKEDLANINKRASELSLQPLLVSSPPSGGGFIKNRETNSVTEDACFVGRGNDVSTIVTQLTATCNNARISVLPIVGLGGIGKTTLARNVFNDPKIKEHFGDKNRMWVCVSDDFSANRLFSLMLESLKSPMPEVTSEGAKVGRLKELLEDSKYLLVLDDVWNEDFGLWNGFLNSLRGTSQAIGSWILVSTRKQGVANITRISAPEDHSLKQLSDDQCLCILQANAGVVERLPYSLQDVGLKIARKCQGLPLAASLLGGMLKKRAVGVSVDKWEAFERELQSGGVGENSGIEKILKLSFDDLPYLPLKKCFAYCSIFSKDFEIERSQLIQLWAAEGFLHSKPKDNMCMEDVGDMYFTILLNCNLFQDAEEDEFGTVLNCKMHDLVHDMVQSISHSKTLKLTESCNGDEEKSRIQYLALERSGQEMGFLSTEKFKCITTLFLLEDRSLNDKEMSFFMLRVLRLRSPDVMELPKSIGKLIHLRYLDPSGTSIKTMPDSVCRLYNLQTLRIEYCELLTEFPNNFKNLMNLTYFKLHYCSSYEELPTLGHLPSLVSLHLEGLRGITIIRPSFYASHSGSSSQSPLKLFPALKHFILRRMINLTEWTEATIGDSTVVVFPVLELIEIDYSPDLATFPTHFPCLKKLRVEYTNNGPAIMAYIDSGVSTLTHLNFCYVRGLTHLPIKLFQSNSKLAHIQLVNCPDLTQFSDFSFDVPQTSEGPPDSQTILELSQPHVCIDIDAAQPLVGLKSLEVLFVSFCHSLESISIPKGDKYLTALRKIGIADCWELAHVSIPQITESAWDPASSPSLSAACPPLLALEKLVVFECYNLISFPIDLIRTPFLSSLDISHCEKLTDLPKGKLCSLTSLRDLHIGPFSETTTELHSFLDLFDALPPPPHLYLPSLSVLYMRGWPHWESLPDQLQHLSALTDLTLRDFGVKSLPDWFGSLSSLEELRLDECEKLENLPQSMKSLTRLRELEISRCPLLKERCNPESSSSTDPNSEWSKISHIPKIYIYGQQIRG